MRIAKEKGDLSQDIKIDQDIPSSYSKIIFKKV